MPHLIPSLPTLPIISRF